MVRDCSDVVALGQTLRSKPCWSVELTRAHGMHQSNALSGKYANNVLRCKTADAGTCRPWLRKWHCHTSVTDLRTACPTVRADVAETAFACVD